MNSAGSHRLENSALQSCTIGNAAHWALARPQCGQNEITAHLILIVMMRVPKAPITTWRCEVMLPRYVLPTFELAVALKSYKHKPELNTDETDISATRVGMDASLIGTWTRLSLLHEYGHCKAGRDQVQAALPHMLQSGL
jgi:hypothetical protein